jgi:uncharacterized protein
MSDVTVSQLWRFPVKSMQGSQVDRIEVDRHGVAGDRRWGLFDLASDKLMSAKRWSALLMASAHIDDGDVRIELPDGSSVQLGDPATSARLSEWLGRPVEARRTRPETRAVYEMTLDPPNDEAELFDIPTPSESFADLAPIHLLSATTLTGAAQRHPSLDWDVRRFRPNLVVEGVTEPFGEDTWTGADLRVGGAVLRVVQPTVRCAMPLRAQPGIDRQRDLYEALEALHANHLGVYVEVVEPGEIAVGDRVEVAGPP